MTKEECLERAARARAQHEKDIERFATLAVLFGSNDTLTQAAQAEADKSRKASNEWVRVSQWHPSTRAAAIRRQSLPVFMFGY